MPKYRESDADIDFYNKFKIEEKILQAEKLLLKVQEILRQKPDLFEIADSYFKNSGYTKLESKCGSNCFDGVYMKNGELYVVEVKPLSRNAINLSSNKNSPNNIGVQMSNEWIISRTDELVKTRNPQALKTAELINKAIDTGKPVNKIVVGVNDSRAVTLNLGNKVTR